MTKKQRIAALEARIAQLEGRLAAVEGRPYWHWTWTNPQPYVVTTGGTGAAYPHGITDVTYRT